MSIVVTQVSGPVRGRRRGLGTQGSRGGVWLHAGPPTGARTWAATVVALGALPACVSCVPQEDK